MKLACWLILDKDLDAAVDRIVDSNYETKIKYCVYSRQKKEGADE